MRNTSPRAKSTDHPRIRGEHPTSLRNWISRAGSSPHTRGAQRLARSGDRVFRIIPAYAGSTRVPQPRGGRRGDHPRIRGEHLGAGPVERTDGGSSPHTRGALVRELVGGGAPVDHPRIRGEHVLAPVAQSRTAGSSPHTRGAPRQGRQKKAGRRIIPAYAGSTRRGWVFAVRALGSSPHTRGALPEAGFELADVGIIPAYAGSTRRGRPCRRGRSDHPRIRGEHRCHRSRGNAP